MGRDRAQRWYSWRNLRREGRAPDIKPFEIESYPIGPDVQHEALDRVLPALRPALLRDEAIVADASRRAQELAKGTTTLAEAAARLKEENDGAEDCWRTDQGDASGCRHVAGRSCRKN